MIDYSYPVLQSRWRHAQVHVAWGERPLCGKFNSRPNYPKDGHNFHQAKRGTPTCNECIKLIKKYDIVPFDIMSAGSMNIAKAFPLTYLDSNNAFIRAITKDIRLDVSHIMSHMVTDKCAKSGEWNAGDRDWVSDINKWYNLISTEGTPPLGQILVHCNGAKVTLVFGDSNKTKRTREGLSYTPISLPYETLTESRNHSTVLSGGIIGYCPISQRMLAEDPFAPPTQISPQACLVAASSGLYPKKLFTFSHEGYVRNVVEGAVKGAYLASSGISNTPTWRFSSNWRSKHPIKKTSALVNISYGGCYRNGEDKSQLRFKINVRHTGIHAPVFGDNLDEIYKRNQTVFNTYASKSLAIADIKVVFDGDLAFALSSVGHSQSRKTIMESIFKDRFINLEENMSYLIHTANLRNHKRSVELVVSKERDQYRFANSDYSGGFTSVRGYARVLEHIVYAKLGEHGEMILSTQEPEGE